MRWFLAWVRASRKHPRVLIALGIALVLVAFHGRTLLGHWVLSADRWHFSDDARVLVHPQFRWEDPSLFPRDPAVSYFLSSLPEGYRLVYRALGPLVGVSALSKALPSVLLALTLLCLGLVAGRLSGAAAVLGTLSLALGSAYVLGRMVGGLPRAFALPFLAAGAWTLASGRVRTLSVLAVLATGFYPAVGLTLGAALAFTLLLPAADRGSAREWSLKKRGAVLVVTALAAGLVILPTALRLRPWGSAITPAMWREYPEAGPGGRFDAMDRAPFPALPAAALVPLEAALVGAGDSAIAGLDLRKQGSWLAPSFVLVGLVGWAVLARRSSDARRLLLLPLALVVCHTLSLWVEPLLFLPERYVAYAVPLVALLAAPTALGALGDAPRRWLRALPLVYNVVLIVALGATGVPWTGLTIFVPKAERPLYGKLAALPKNAVIAAIPSDPVDSIPLLTRRSVFLARETHMPFHTGYTDLMRGRARALFAAYYATDADALVKFRNEWGVTHLLIDTTHYASPPSYFAPFDIELTRAFARGRTAGFAVPGLRARTEVFAQGSLVLLDLGRL